MIYTEMTYKALNIAYNAHMGQTDRCGAPYIFHPYEVASEMKDETSTAVALLHDVLEDTAVTAEQLERAGIPHEIVEIVKILTHGDNEEYMDYVARVAKNPVARAVKIADLHHNMNKQRNALMKYPTHKSPEIYKKALEYLTNYTD